MEKVIETDENDAFLKLDERVKNLEKSVVRIVKVLEVMNTRLEKLENRKLLV